MKGRVRMQYLTRLRAVLSATALGLLAACATAPPPEARPFEQMSAPGVRWGAVVTTLDGRELVSVRGEERFIPASNTKLFTAAAAFHFLSDLETPDPAHGTSLWIEQGAEGEPPSLVLKGAGDASLTDRLDCVENCLHQLADAAVAAGITRVSDVIGDDNHLAAATWGQGWSWNNFVWYYAAPVSSLSVNENTLGLRIEPAMEGMPVEAGWLAGDDFLIVENRAMTGPPGSDQTLRIERTPGTGVVRLTGSVPADAAARTYALAVTDPAQTAAMRLIRLLKDRGVVVEGAALARHEPVALAPGAFLPTEIARLTPPALASSLRRIQQDSQNLHAELMLRRIAAARGELSPEGGQEALAALIFEAGLSPVEIELFDGSGMSSYNRVTPRSVAAFLRWAAGQPWGDDWRATLPRAGLDGTLTRRFRGTPLEGRLLAKTGSLHGVNALSGFMEAASGQVLIFSVFAADRPADVPSIIAAMDAELLRIAAEN
ncbi:MAG: D-alanyl-D-alanine carboxypeptidase/D-alanyl-D-alanine-endopeptidase [Hyphomonas sp.]